MSGISSTQKFRADIEGLRAVAVLLVVAFHSGFSAFRGGFIGVDVFFVLSGYLITGLLIDEIERSNRIDVIQFYARRVRRLLPASAVVVTITVLAGAILLPPLEQVNLGKTALSTFLYASNLYFAHARNDYFAADVAGNPLLHTWSLAVEEQFYIVWPVLLFVAWRIGRRSQRSVIWAMASTTVLSFIGCVWLTHTNQTLAFFLSPARAWEFGLGGLFRVIPVVQSKRMADLCRVCSWLGLVTILLCGSLFSSAMRFPGAIALLPALGTGAVLVAGRSGLRGSADVILRTRPLLYLGTLSYSLYLWHWPILVLTAATVPHFSLAVRCLCVLSSVGLAALTDRVVTNPIRFNSFLVSRPFVNLATAFAITILGAASVRIWNHQVSRSPSYVPYASAMEDIPSLYKRACRTDFTESVPKECTFGDKTSRISVVLFGDSHAAQWFPALETLAKERKWKLTTLVKSSCPAIAVASFNTFLQRQETECDEWRERALSRIVALRPDAVVLGTLSTYYQPEHPERSVTTQEWEAGARKTFGRLDAAAVTTIFIRDTPYPGFHVPKCLATLAWTKRGRCDNPVRSVALNGPVFEAERKAARLFSHVNVIDLSDAICGPETCELVRDGEILYRDQNHLTGSFVRELAPALATQIFPIIRPMSTATARLELPELRPEQAP